MSDITERLRNWVKLHSWRDDIKHSLALLRDAADHIEALEVKMSRLDTEIERLRRERNEAFAKVERMRAMVPDVAPPTVENIVLRYLEAHGLDGLWNDDAGCGCSVEDLAPCCEISLECQAGVKVDGCTCGQGCAFHIVPRSVAKACDPREDDDDQKS
jgi:hypothetical protein